MSIVDKFVGDGLYMCPNGFASDEAESVFIEIPKGPSGQRLLCHSKNCQKTDCNFHPRYRNSYYGQPPLNFPEKMLWERPLEKRLTRIRKNRRVL